MTGFETPYRRLATLGLAAALLPPLLAFTAAPARSLGSAGAVASEARAVPQPADEAKQIQLGSPAAGERLFAGVTRFANGGPACLSCHNIAGLPFPGGGVLGPDLTGSWNKYGPLALAPVLNTLYFPTMVPIFTSRPLTPVERNDLAAFLRAEAGKAPPTGATVELLALAIVGAAVLLAMVRLAWPRRLRGVRRGLLERVGPAEGSTQ